MKFRYREEQEMKDSGVKWIGKIPKDWDVSRIEREFNVRNEKVSDRDFPPLSVTKQGILPQLESVAKTDNNDNRKKVCINDFVINSRADRKGSCGVSSYDGSVSLICNVITPKRLHSKYVHNLFRNYYFSEEFYRWGSGIVDDLWSTNIEKMKKISIPILNNNEDIKIGKFLDEKINQFDLIISKKETLIQKLEEAKKSFISEVVTGKVKVVKTEDSYELLKRSKEEMKDSGVRWLGYIPKEWNITKLKHLVSIKITDGPHETPKFLDEGVPFLSAEAIINSEISIPNMRGYISEELCEIYDKKSSVYKNDILFCKSGSTTGKAALVKTDEKFAIWSPLAIIRANKKIHFKNLFYVIQSNYFRIQVENYWTFGTQPNIGMGTLENLHILYSKNMDEQTRIIEYLDDKVVIINNLINKTQQQIQKIKEAKQSLISEAVTGKIEILD